MEYYLPSYDECLKICKDSNGLFYETKFIVDGFNISIFNYRLSTYYDFVRYSAFELRGLTFVFNNDNSLYKRFLLMEKFFNLNENESTQLDIIKNKQIKSVFQKEDGSIISFIQLPSGKILAKSKNSLTSEQSELAQIIYQNDPKLNTFVKNCLENDLTPIFELVGPQNRIVVKYEVSNLILIRLRDNKTGAYQDIKCTKMDIPNFFETNLDDLLILKASVDSIEGWIVEFSDSQKIKIKTDWYLSLHRIMTDYTNREDYLIEMILDDKIDDILSVLDIDSKNRIFVEKIVETTNKNISIYIHQVNVLINNFNGDRKEFAINHKRHELFSVAMKVIDGKDIMLALKDFIKKKTYKLSQARQWLFPFS